MEGRGANVEVEGLKSPQVDLEANIICMLILHA